MKKVRKMKTIQWTVDSNVDNSASYPQIQEAARLLAAGEAVAFPTETVYGLGADATNDQAVAKIFEAKGRPADNPLIVHIAGRAMLDKLASEVPEQAERLISAFWPGPLTIILRRKAGVLSDFVTAGLDSVGIRMPDHPVALALIEASGLPIAAPSANRSGKPSPTAARHVLDDLEGRIGGIVDGGETGVGVESTVVDCTGDIPVILRPGGITKEQLEKAAGRVEMDSALSGEGRPKAPGMKYTHYAPDAPLYLMSGTPGEIQEMVRKKRLAGQRVGVLATEESAPLYDADLIIPCGARQDLRTVAHSLYDTLRAFNEGDLDLIISEVFPSEGVGLAIMNRLEKASGGRHLRSEGKR